MKTSEVLDKAADLIEERGWRQGEGWISTRTRDDSTLCLEGGVMAALGLRPEFVTAHSLQPLLGCPAYAAVADYLDLDHGFHDDIPEPREPLYRWNDRKSRTATEVLEVLRAAAVIEAAREEQDAAWETYAELVTP